MSNSLRVVCVGIDPHLLETRRLVLQSAGFEATCLTPLEISQGLLPPAFDVMIISVGVSEEDRPAVRAAVPDRTRVIQLEAFIEPQQLLDLLRA
jgi:hypothetical protein